jgi:short-subunit dehydrogenase
MSGSDAPVAAITGAAGGIGMAMARVFSAAGYRLALCDVEAPRLEEAVSALDLPDDNVHCSAFDLREPDAIEAWAQEVDRNFGRVDLLINNAGTMTWGTYEQMTREEVDLVMDVNLRAALHACHVFIPLLVRDGGGHIVNVASMSALFASPYQTTYNASKWALRGFSSGLRMELRTKGVGVTCVMPGTIATEFMRRARTHDARSSERLAAGMLKVGASPRRVAIKTRRAVRWNFGEQLVGIDAYLVATMQRFLPGLLDFVMSRAFPMIEARVRRD